VDEIPHPQIDPILTALLAAMLVARAEANKQLGKIGSARSDLVRAGRLDPKSAAVKRAMETLETPVTAPMLPSVAPVADAAAAPTMVEHPAVQSAKDDGNKSYKVGQFGEAVEHYTRAMEALRAVISTTRSTAAPGNVSTSNEDTMAMLLTNRAQARLQDGQLRGCADDCTEALALHPGNVKALLRRGCVCG
jgi:tetratricopeptide (TPR) repeat protein